MKNNVLILKKNGNDLFFSNQKNVLSFFKKNNSIIFKIFKKLDLPLNIFFANWKKVIYQFDTVIFFDNGFNIQISKYIKKHYPNIKCILWYWNGLNEYNGKIIRDKSIDEIWTYSLSDSKKYNLKYNTQFYKKIEIKKDNTIASDIVYLGRDKGRFNTIKCVEEMLISKDIKCNFNVIKKGQKNLKYIDYLNNILNSKCILDINSNNNDGLSLRPLEALFYEKKLITDNKNIKNYDFYNKNNIFILGLDNLDQLNFFVNSPYKKIDLKIVEYYEFDNWLKRFM